VSTMSVEERTRVIDWLDESHKEFVASISGLSDAQWKWKPAPERWSIGETAEHIVLAEALLWLLLPTPGARSRPWVRRSSSFA
jgi:hypothetical protein